MGDDDRLARLEHRLTVVEGLVRQLLADRAAPVPGPVPAASPAVPSPASAPAPALGRSPAPPAAAPRPAPSRPPSRPSRGLAIVNEEWLGQRGLLAVGVVFVILAAGYLLKLSFDRGWVSPLVRCVGGVVVGLGIGALGWRLHGRGTRTYGAALIGAGAAIGYLAVWAAARLYQFLPPGPAVGALALIAVGLAAIAWAIDLEALGATAAVGAFLAPVVIGREAGSVNLLLLYLGTMGAGLGAVGAARRWRLATLVVALAYFGIATAGLLRHANPYALYLYGILGGTAGLYVGLRESWFETRVLAFAGGWTVLFVANAQSDFRWLTLAGGLVLVAPVWWRALTSDTVLPGWRGKPDAPSLGETLYFYLSPFLLGAALDQVAPDRFRDLPGLVPALVALPYLAAGYQDERRPFALVGVVALAAGAALQWPGLGVVWALLLLAHLWAALDHLFRRIDGRAYALGTYGLALLTLLQAAARRPPAEPAFTGAWALVLWVAIETGIALAAGLLRRTGAGPDPLYPAVWLVAGLLGLFGVTGELLRFFELAGMPPEDARLAGGLAVSAWWILFAAGCFGAGFHWHIKPLRLAGFAVAGLALAKVLLVDLSTLDAFYRIGSALVLGLVSLAVAYAYHRGALRRGN